MTALLNEQLIDLFYLMYNPILLGSGKLMNGALKQFTQLKRVDVIPFEGGGVLLKYECLAK